MFRTSEVYVFLVVYPSKGTSSVALMEGRARDSSYPRFSQTPGHFFSSLGVTESLHLHV